jgi:hypothetical protein
VKRIDDQWRALAGKGAGASGDFKVTYNGRPIRAAYALNSDDDIVSLTLSISYDAVARARGEGLYRGASPLVATRPLDIELRREDPADRAAKRDGVSVEWQAGDPGFDDVVYVSSPTSDAQVLAAVLGPEVRAGVLELLGFGFESVGIDLQGRVLATIGSRELRADREPNAGERALEAYDRILGNLPVVTHSGEKHAAAPLSRVTGVLVVIGATGWLTNVGYVAFLGLTFKQFRRDDPQIPTAWVIAAVALAIFAGIVGAWLYARVVRHYARGRSNAHREIGTASFAAFGGFSVLAFTLVAALVYALAPGPK